MPSIGKKLKAIATDRNFNLKELAEAAGIPYRSMQNYSSEAQLPGIDVLLKLRGSFNIDLNWLLDESADDRSKYVTQDRIDQELFERVVAEIRSDDSELRQMKLEGLLHLIIAIYNSVEGLPQDEQQRSIRSQVLLASKVFLKITWANLESYANEMNDPMWDELRQKVRQTRIDLITTIDRKRAELGASDQEDEDRLDNQ